MLRRSMSGNLSLNTSLAATSGVVRRNDPSGSGGNAGMGSSGSKAAYRVSLVSHYAEDLDRRRRQERMFEDGRTESEFTNRCLVRF